MLAASVRFTVIASQTRPVVFLPDHPRGKRKTAACQYTCVNIDVFKSSIRGIFFFNNDVSVHESSGVTEYEE